MTEKKAVAARVDALESQVRSVACLANATAKGVGKDKVQRQWVAFVQGPCRAKLEEVWAGWKAGASRAKEGGAAAAAAASSETKVVPFKLQVFNLLVEQLAEQGLDQEVLGGAARLQAGRRRGVRAKPRATRRRRETVGVRAPVSSVVGGSVSVAVAPFAGSSSNCGQEGWCVYQRKVLEDLGHTPDEVKAWFGGKGAAGSGKGSQGVSGLGKRAAGTRLSLVEERDKKR